MGTILCIMDGVGLGTGGADDAVATANTPYLDRLLATAPWLALRAHGTAVGMPSDNDMGNSEVGHNTIGGGRVFDQGARLVNRAFENQRAWKTDVWRDLCATQTLHLLGLVSDGNVHSHVAHLHELIRQAARDNVQRLRVHALTDGRDVGPRTALTWFEPLERLLTEHQQAGRDYRIASGGGRMNITMDRYEADWPMVSRGWQCHVHGVGRRFASATDAIRTLYDEDPDVDDQTLSAFVCTDDSGEPNGTIRDGDGVLLFNFRGDRAIEISEAFSNRSFNGFDRGAVPRVVYAGMMQYDGDRAIPDRYLVEPPRIDDTVGERLVRAKRRTFACSETQKFGHVTYFFNGNRSGRIDDALETYIEIPSDNVPFDERPHMKAKDITDACVQAIRSRDYEHVRLNLANGDMVGHTGNLTATRTAVEVVDACVGRLIDAARETGDVLLVTADHGNADQMYARNGKAIRVDANGEPVPLTSHTLNTVPFALFDPKGAARLRRIPSAGLANISATLLDLCDVDVPESYAPSLIDRGGA